MGDRNTVMDRGSRNRSAQQRRYGDGDGEYRGHRPQKTASGSRAINTRQLRGASLSDVVEMDETGRQWC